MQKKKTHTHKMIHNDPNQLNFSVRNLWVEII